MKVLFIQPSGNNADGNLKGGVWKLPPLGIISLASYIIKEGHECNVIDLSIQEEDLNCRGYDYVAFSVTTPLLSEAKRLAKNIKENYPNIKIIFGGSHPSLDTSILKESFIDFLAIGEGEITLTELLNNRPLKEINGLAYKDKGIKVNKPRELIKDLDSLPTPAYNLLDICKYPSHPLSTRKPNISIITSRGCPYGCTYCSKSVFGRTFRAKGYKKVVDEMEYLIKRYGIKEFQIVDDTFTLDKERVKDICKEMIKRKLNVKWMTPNGIRAGSVDLETLKLMKKAGCYYLYLGIESGSQRILDEIKKEINVEEVVETVNLINKAKIRVGGFFMMGFPKETEEDIEKTINLSLKLKLDSVKFGILVPFPGSEIFEEYKSKGIIKNFDYSSYFWHKEPVFETEYLSKEKMFEYYKSAYKRFYLRPTYIIKKILSTRSFSDIKNIINGFFVIIKIQIGGKE